MVYRWHLLAIFVILLSQKSRNWIHKKTLKLISQFLFSYRFYRRTISVIKFISIKIDKRLVNKTILKARTYQRNQRSLQFAFSHRTTNTECTRNITSTKITKTRYQTLCCIWLFDNEQLRDIIYYIYVYHHSHSHGESHYTRDYILHLICGNMCMIRCDLFQFEI